MTGEGGAAGRSGRGDAQFRCIAVLGFEMPRPRCEGWSQAGGGTLCNGRRVERGIETVACGLDLGDRGDEG